MPGSEEGGRWRGALRAKGGQEGDDLHPLEGGEWGMTGARMGLGEGLEAGPAGRLARPWAVGLEARLRRRH